MDIGVVAKKSGIPVSTLRYYEEIGLIKSHARKGLRRQFSEGVLEQLAIITIGKEAGFKLEELTSYIMSSKTPLKINREKLLKKAKEITKQIEKLSAIRDGLIRAANCKSENHLHCPTFQRLMALSTKKQKKKSLPK